MNADGRQFHHPRSPDDVVLTPPSTSQVERNLTDFDRVCDNIGRQLNLKLNSRVSMTHPHSTKTNVSECSSYAYLSREANKDKNLVPEFEQGDLGAMKK